MKDQSIGEVMATLESRVELFKEREAYHAQQEAFHQKERTRFAAELETVSRHLEAFRAAASIAARDLGPVAPMSQEDLGTASRPKLSRMVQQVLAGVAPEARFGIRWMAQELNRRFGSRLRKPADERRISVVLRRFHRRGLLDLARRGRPHWEALYSKPKGG